jgi:hypothetical protein
MDMSRAECDRPLMAYIAAQPKHLHLENGFSFEVLRQSCTGTVVHEEDAHVNIRAEESMFQMPQKLGRRRCVVIHGGDHNQPIGLALF